MEYKKLNTIFGWLVWAIATVVYLLTIEPTTSFWDCGEFIATAYNLEVGHPPGAPLFMLIGRFFTLFASNETAAAAINTLSALSSSFTILFLFWTITAFTKKLALVKGELSSAKVYAILGSGVVGALAYTFSDSFWFSAAEGEVYAMSSLFTAVVFWAILKWEAVADEPSSSRWLVLIAYLMGLSIGVHLLNLLAIPAIVYVYYFKKKPLTTKGFFIAGALSILVLGIVQFGIIPGTYKIGSMFELLFVNSFGLPFHSGLIFYVILLTALIGVALLYTHKKGKALWNTVILCFTVILIGYSTFAVILVRSSANPPMDENNPENAFSLLSYLNREQYGDTPLLKGQFFNTPVVGYEEAKPAYYQNKETGKYEQTNEGVKNQPVYDKKTSGIFPRMWSSQGHHIKTYKNWTNFKGKKTRASNGEMINKPTFAENMTFFFKYQIGHLYWRYFMWNFAGKQNDIQGHGEITKGNWISGITPFDAGRLGNQDKLPKSITDNAAHNKFYFLPLLLGLLGLIYQLRNDNKNWLVVALFFFFTGLAIIIYNNQPPIQPRERDYAYVGSFYAFAVWIGLGVYALFDFLSQKIPAKASVAVATIVCLLAVPTIMAKEGWDDHDRSNRFTARDFARNYLNSCAPNAILFTNGDNDTFPLWYVQEVEQYRTDVRVVNLSLLNTDWYIEQMRRKAWDSDGIPQQIPEHKIRQGTNDYIPIYEKGIKGFVDVDEIIDFVTSDNPQTKVGVNTGKQVDYIPTKNLKVSVDKKKVLENGTVDKKYADRIVDNIEWNIKKNYVLKNDLIILDILAANDWERPIYFAITTGNDSYIGLTDYFQLEGLAYRLVPYKAQVYDGQTGEINTDIMYDNLMNKFAWGGMEKDKVYMDENNRRMCMNFRNNFSRLATDFIRKGENKKAIEVLDRCVEVIPESNVPYNYFILPIAESYYQLKEYEKGNEIVRKLVDTYHDDLTYYLSLSGEHKKNLRQDIDRSKYILQRIILLTNDEHKECGLAKEMEQRFNEINNLLKTDGPMF